MNTQLIVNIVSIVLTNGVLLLVGVWRFSGWFARIEVQLSHLNEKLNTHADTTTTRLNSLEARVLNIERAQRAAAD